MNAPALKRMTVNDYLAWAETQTQGKYELFRGEIIAMSPERLGHARSKLAVVQALAASIKKAGLPCEAIIDSLGVCIDDETCYIPDTLVNCGSSMSANVMIAANPIVVVEVLSPSSRHIDKTIKLADYFTVAGLSHYLIIDLDKRHVLHNRRRTDGTITVERITGGDITLDPPGLTLAVADLFGDAR
jgi:Uma2 family endonuclease